jgi:hypothetical protein
LVDYITIEPIDPTFVEPKTAIVWTTALETVQTSDNQKSALITLNRQKSTYPLDRLPHSTLFTSSCASSALLPLKLPSSHSFSISSRTRQFTERLSKLIQHNSRFARIRGTNRANETKCHSYFTCSLPLCIRAN